MTISSISALEMAVFLQIFNLVIMLLCFHITANTIIFAVLNTVYVDICSDTL